MKRKIENGLRCTDNGQLRARTGHSRLKVIVWCRWKLQISSVCTIMHLLTDKFVEPSMDQTFIVNLHGSRFSIVIVQTGGSVE
jgi:hypothetical protein